MASLTKRQGTLGKRLAAHLLRRTTYNITSARITAFSNMTAEQAVDSLFVFPLLTEPKGPINPEDGTTYWLTDGPYTSRPSSDFHAGRYVRFWWYNELLNDVSIRHKLAVFHSEIYVSHSDADWRLFDAFRLFQYFAKGNIKELARRITLDNRMSRYLNNNVNNKWSPNENYAREFFELFTILKGEQIAEGNYTNYTEDDIHQAARLLTGFRDGDQTDIEPVTGLTINYAQYNRHDNGNKQFSQAFNHRVIIGAVDEADMYRELQEFIDMIFDKIETAKAFVRRLYLFFVNDKMSDEIEADIIEPLALQLWSDNYELENTLKKLLKSIHFYDEDDSDNTDNNVGGKIKSPLELSLCSINLFDANNMGNISADPANYSNYANQFIGNIIEIMGMPVYPTSVEGYAGYFKSPSFSKNWIDTSTLPMRYRYSEALINGTVINNQWINLPFQLDVVDFVKNNFSSPEYADMLLTQILEITLPEPLDDVRRSYFRNKLLGGLTTINWMFDWQNYIASNDDSSVRVTLEDLFGALIGSPEFQTF